jgi:hypothetical protein
MNLVPENYRSMIQRTRNEDRRVMFDALPLWHFPGAEFR